MNAPARLLTAWDRCCKRGYSLTPCNFLVLCDIMHHAAEPISCQRRARRLHISQPSVSDALHAAAHYGLVTLVTTPLPASAQSHSHPMTTPTTPSLQEQLDDRDATINELQERLQDRTTGFLEAVQAMGLEIARLKRENTLLTAAIYQPPSEIAQLEKNNQEFWSAIHTAYFTRGGAEPCAPANLVALEKNVAAQQSIKKLFSQNLTEARAELESATAAFKNYRELIASTLDKTCAPTHHPAHTAPHPKPMTPAERILALHALASERKPLVMELATAIDCTASSDTDILEEAIKHIAYQKEKLRDAYALALYEQGHITAQQAKNLCESACLVNFRLYRENTFARMCQALGLPETPKPLPIPSEPGAGREEIDKIKRIHALLRPGNPAASIDIVACIEKLVKRGALFDWIAQHIGNIDFHVQVPNGVMSSKPWIALGTNFEACIAKAKSELTKTLPPAPHEALFLPRPPMNTCTSPPPGWKCTRPAGHDGPCAAIEQPNAPAA